MHNNAHHRWESDDDDASRAASTAATAITGGDGRDSGIDQVSTPEDTGSDVCSTVPAEEPPVHHRLVQSSTFYQQEAGAIVFDPMQQQLPTTITSPVLNGGDAMQTPRNPGEDSRRSSLQLAVRVSVQSADDQHPSGSSEGSAAVSPRIARLDATATRDGTHPVHVLFDAPVSPRTDRSHYYDATTAPSHLGVPYQRDHAAALSTAASSTSRSMIGEPKAAFYHHPEERIGATKEMLPVTTATAGTERLRLDVQCEARETPVASPRVETIAWAPKQQEDVRPLRRTSCDEKSFFGWLSSCFKAPETESRTTYYYYRPATTTYYYSPWTTIRYVPAEPVTTFRCCYPKVRQRTVYAWEPVYVAPRSDVVWYYDPVVYTPAPTVVTKVKTTTSRRVLY